MEERKRLFFDCYNKAKSKAKYEPYWYKIKPTPLTMDDGRIINVEYVQPSYISDAVLINYRTDGLSTEDMSKNELKQLLAIIQLN